MPATKAQTAARVSLANPVLVEVTRGPRVESRHRGAAAVADTSGKLVAAWGQVEEAVYPRSAIKPLQALAVIETGAADAFAMSESEIALACASHSGQPIHTRGGRRLARPHRARGRRPRMRRAPAFPSALGRGADPRGLSALGRSQ